MATIVRVHGTFAHSGSPSDTASDAASEPQWWQTDSTFQRELKTLVDPQGGDLDVTSFEWSGDNSEAGRRKAGLQLLKHLRALEADNEPYCVVGHSHGGSVIASALLAGAAKRQSLPNLKRWITVGTPFVNFRKERWLFTRLDLLRKVIFVASMMLFLMFVVYLVTTLATGEELLFGRTFPAILVVTGVMMSLPIIVFYIVLRFLDSRSLLLHRRRVIRRARENFGSRWLSLAHPDDEAIQGLAFLPGAKLYFFDKSFAVSAITSFSVIALPLLYLLVLTSPLAMNRIADWLNTDVYASRSTPEAEEALKSLQQQLRDARASRRAGAGDATEVQPANGSRAFWRDYRAKRRELRARFPNLPSVERTLRFRQRFFQRDGVPCEGGKLCGGGRDLAINSGLLLHVATDELSWIIGTEDPSDWRNRNVASLLLPVVLVPLISGLIALVLMLLIRGIAIVVSRTSSALLNQLTNSEVRRAAFGNDTEGEIAVGAVDRPVWLERSQPRLPSAVGDLISAYSNTIAAQSLSKFRRAIGQLASAEPKHTADTAITTYFTWKELVHAAYFDVAEFRKLIAQAVSRAEGFAPSARFKADADYAKTAQWLAEIEGTPGRTGDIDTSEPGPHDGAAVSAVVASTVKAEP
jgi:hypothetical protein